MEKKENLFLFSVKDIAECGMLIGLALILNFIKIPVSGNAGSINLQVLPLFILSLRKGPFKGLICCGVAYGLVSCLIDNYGFATFPFDYLLGFGSCAVVGFFSSLVLRKEKLKWTCFLFALLGCLAATFVRFVGGCLSSMVIYGYDFKASVIYNAAYIGISGAASAAVFIALLPAIRQIDKLFPHKD